MLSSVCISLSSLIISACFSDLIELTGGSYFNNQVVFYSYIYADAQHIVTYLFNRHFPRPC